MTEDTNWTAYKIREEKRRNETISYLNELRPLLMKEGFKVIAVHYEGCGDSGEAYEAEGFKHMKHDTEHYHEKEHFETRLWDTGKSEEIPIDEWKCTRYQNVIRKIELEFLNNKSSRDLNGVPELPYAITEMIQYDWYNNEGGAGRIIWELEDNKVIVDGWQYFHDTEDKEESYNLDEVV